MLTALYYPHVVLSEELFKNALFLWDSIEYIAPFEGFRPAYKNHELREAVQNLAVPRVPSEREMEQVDMVINDLIKGGLPDWFLVEKVPKQLRYSLYAKKLLHRTWRNLERHYLAKVAHDQFATSAALGFAIMSILADCLGGKERRLITDEGASYSALNRFLLTIGGGELGNLDQTRERLVSISLKVMNLKNVSLGRLVGLREKEKSSKGASLRRLRHEYLKRIEAYTDQIAKVRNNTDKEEIERIFEQEIRDDFNLLKDELKDEAKKVVFSKGMAAAVIAIVGATIEPISGYMVAGGALYLKKIEYRASRNKVLKSHPMAWLYSARKLPLY